jgi:hypothetical protein
MVKGSLLVAVVLSSSAVACSVSPAGQELFSSPSSTSPSPTPKPTPSPSPVPVPCADDVGCGPDETTYATVTACTSAGMDRCRRVQSNCTGSVAFYCGSSDVTCDAYPECDAGDLEVASCGSGGDCYSRTACGTTITCQRPYANCKALPTCDAGDPQVLDFDDCKTADSDCYSRTTCGITIWCNNVN